MPTANRMKFDPPHSRVAYLVVGFVALSEAALVRLCGPGMIPSTNVAQDWVRKLGWRLATVDEIGQELCLRRVCGAKPSSDTTERTWTWAPLGREGNSPLQVFEVVAANDSECSQALDATSPLEDLAFYAQMPHASERERAQNRVASLLLFACVAWRAPPRPPRAPRALSLLRAPLPSRPLSPMSPTQRIIDIMIALMMRAP